MENGMGVVLFLLMHLYVIARLLLLPIAYVVIIIFIAKTAFHKSRTAFKSTFLLIAIIIPIVWLANGYYAFRVACDTAKFEDFSKEPIENVDGFLVRSHGWRYYSQAPKDLLMQGQYEYLESKYSDKQGYSQEKRYGFGTKSTFTKDRQSHFDFEVTHPESVTPVLKPGFKISKIRILNAASGDVEAQAVEFVYGGGLIGEYIVYLFNGWNQGNDTYGCGYVDRNIHLFRSQNLYKEYLAKDREFIQKMLIPKQTGASVVFHADGNI
jgi:hypothetical protein